MGIWTPPPSYWLRWKIRAGDWTRTADDGRTDVKNRERFLQRFIEGFVAGFALMSLALSPLGAL